MIPIELSESDGSKFLIVDFSTLDTERLRSVRWLVMDMPSGTDERPAILPEPVLKINWKNDHGIKAENLYLVYEMMRPRHY